MRIIFLILGTVALALFILKGKVGEKYEDMLENLDPSEYPLSSLYGIGFAWGELPMFSLKDKMKEKLIGQAKLLYDPKYAEYYANVTWAQMLTFIHLGLAVGLVLAGLFNHILMLAVGIVIAGVFAFSALNRMNDAITTREKECTAELPEIVSTMTLLVNAGMMLRDAWRMIAETKEGIVYQLMLDSCVDMENGMSEVDAIHKFGRMTNSPETRKFTSALAQSLERGGSELADFLGRQTTEIWALKKQTMLQKGEAAATKLLLPTVLLFASIILVVITGALGMIIGG